MGNIQTYIPSGTQNCMLPTKSGLIVYLEHTPLQACPRHEKQHTQTGLQQQTSCLAFLVKLQFIYLLPQKSVESVN